MVGEAANGREAIEKFKKVGSAVVLIDITMPVIGCPDYSSERLILKWPWFDHKSRVSLQRHGFIIFVCKSQ